MNSLSAAILLLHGAQRGMTARRALAFLYVCENEGLSLHELAMVSRLSDQTASRAVTAMAPQLIAPRPAPGDRRLVVLHLTDEACRLRDAIDAELKAARPIADAPAHVRPAPTPPSAPGVRRRSALVQALEIFRGLGPQLNLMDTLCFLAVAERPGVSLKELGQAFAITKTMASRAVRGFAPETYNSALPPALGLLEMMTDSFNNRSRLACLSPEGEDLVTRLDAIIASAAPLVPDADAMSLGL